MALPTSPAFGLPRIPWTTRTLETLSLAYRVSRVRFWLYLGGTYVAGYALGARFLSEFSEASFALHFLYFLIPANVFLYGINDYFDRDTDVLNPKKSEREHRLQDEERRSLRVLLVLSLGAAIPLLVVQETLLERGLLLGFLVLSFAYSAKPFRLKAVPFADFSSNILYGLPGILAYVQASGMLFPWPAIAAIFLWTSAMHLFSAVPDIEADAKASVRTTAVFLGRKASLLLVFAFWLAFALIVVVWLRLFLPWGLAAFAYPAMALAAVPADGPRTNRLYWSFPYLNAALGFGLFVLAVLTGPLAGG